MTTSLQQAVDYIERLEKQNEALRKQNEHKDMFLSLISHDLRSLFSGIVGHTYLIQHIVEDQQNHALRPLVTQLQQGIENYNALLENLLTWGRAQQGTLEFTRHNIDLSLLIAHNVAVFAPAAAKKEVTLYNSGQSSLMVWADPRMMDTIIRNLLSNAVKFSKPGDTVDIQSGAADMAVSLTVRDTGIGIPPEQVEGLFAVHTKYQRSGTAGEPGTGLGLMLCHEFVTRHGGTMWVKSQPGEGTTIHCVFPHPDQQCIPSQNSERERRARFAASKRPDAPLRAMENSDINVNSPRVFR